MGKAVLGSGLESNSFLDPDPATVDTKKNVRKVGTGIPYTIKQLNITHYLTPKTPYQKNSDWQ
jgi:hypothetical protein